MMKRKSWQAAACVAAAVALGTASGCSVSEVPEQGASSRGVSTRDLEPSGPESQGQQAPPLQAEQPEPAGQGGASGAGGAVGSRPDRRGRFTVARLEARDPRNVKTRDSGLLEEVIKDMNASIGPRLPVDVPVSFAELGQANAFYTPGKRTIVVSYELLNQMIVLFLKNADRDDPKVSARVAQQVIDTLSFVVYHEAAHAMIDLDELPITGKEEDAADQLATVMIVSSARSKAAQGLKRNGITHAAKGGQAAINGALYFLLSSQGSGQSVEDLPFWDEHSLSPQRFYNILTWVYGSDPQRYSNLIQNRILPESRAERAQREYAKVVKSWSRILSDAGAL